MTRRAAKSPSRIPFRSESNLLDAPSWTAGLDVELHMRLRCRYGWS
jgi:hypothetical protein